MGTNEDTTAGKETDRHMIFVVGEALVDRFPDEDRPGGAPFNVACHLKQLAVPVRFVSRVGHDDLGRQFSQTLRRRGFSAGDLQIDPSHGTGIVDVSLDREGVPQFAIRDDAAYDHLDFDHLPDDPAWPGARFVYFGSLIQRSAGGYRRLGALLSRRGPKTRGFCDINLRWPHYSRKSVTQCLVHADVLKLNDEELEEIRRLLGYPVPAADMVAFLMARYHISTVALTRGADGSTISHGGERFDVPAEPVTPVVDTVGAGDGFSAVLAAGLLRRLPMVHIAATAGAFAAAVCRIPGAVPEDPDFHDTWRTRLGASK